MRTKIDKNCGIDKLRNFGYNKSDKKTERFRQGGSGP